MKNSNAEKYTALELCEGLGLAHAVTRDPDSGKSTSADREALAILLGLGFEEVEWKHLRAYYEGQEAGLRLRFVSV